MKDPDWHVMMSVRVSLRIIGDKKAIPDITVALTDENRFVRREAVKSLGRIGDELMVGPLVDALKDEGRSVRLRAEGTLAKHGGDAVIEPLIGALDDSESGVRLCAAQAMEELKNPGGINVIRTTLNLEPSWTIGKRGKGFLLSTVLYPLR